jgi:hypothetical protein
MNIVPADAVYLNTGGIVGLVILLVILLIILKAFHII